MPTPTLRSSDGSQELVFPPDYEQRKRALIQSKGFDPDKFDLDEANGFTITPRKPLTTSSLGASVASTLYGIPDAAVGILGGRIGSVIGGTIGNVPGAVIGGLAGGAGLPMLTAGPLEKLKQAVLPQAALDYVQRAQQEHPTAGFIGNQLSALVGLKPSIQNVKQAGSGVRSMLQGVPLARMAGAEKQALANVAVGAGAGAGLSAGSDIAHSEKPGLEKLSDVNPLNALIGAAGNTLISEPNRLGRVIGLHPTPAPEPGGIPDNPRDLMQGPKVGPKPVEQPMTFPAELKLALQEMGVLGEKDTPEAIEAALAPLRELSKMSPKQRKTESGKIGRQIEALKTQHDLAPEADRPKYLAEIESLKAKSDQLALADLLPQAIKEARERVNAPREDSVMDAEGGMPATGEREVHDPAADRQAILDEQLAEQKRIADEAFAKRSQSSRFGWERRKQAAQDRANAEAVANAKASEMRAADFQRARAEEAAAEAQRTQEAEVAKRAGNLQEMMQAGTVPKRKPYGKLTRSFEQMEQATPERSYADDIQNDLEGLYDPKYPRDSRYSRYGTRYQALDETQLPPEVTQRYADFMREFAKRKGVKMDWHEDVVTEKGEQVAGKLKPRQDPLADALAEISTKGGWDTPPHELLHNLVIELGQGSQAERNLAARALKAFGGNEEALVQASGTKFVERFFRPENESILRDIGNWIKTRFRGGNAEDMTRILTSVLMREGSRAEQMRLNPVRSGVPPKISDTEERTQRFGPQKPPALPSLVGWNILSSETDKLRKLATPVANTVADTLERTFATARNYFGKYGNPLIRAFEKLKPEARERLYSHLVDEVRSGKLATPTTPEEQAAYKEVRQTLAQMAQDQITAGQLLRTGKQRGVDPTYFPQVIDSQIRRILGEGQGTQDFTQVKQDFIDHQLAQGKSQKDADAAFERFMGSMAKDATASERFSFRAVSTPEGVGLPDSWIERDPITAMRKYAKSFTRDRAFYDTIRKNPEVMAALGSKVYENNTPIPTQYANTPNLSRNEQVGRILDAYVGADQKKQEPIINAVARAVNTLLLGGPVTKLTDLASVPFNALKYVAPGQYDDITRGIANWRNGYDHAFKTGFNRRGGLVVAQDILGIGEVAANKLDKFSEFWTKATGSEFLELQARGLSQSIGEFIAASHKRLATAGNAESVKFLDKLGSDWRTQTPEELGTRVAQLLQGKYDITNLPEFVRNSPIAPFLTMMRWSVEQANNFVKFVVEPAKRGNFHPLAMSLVGGVGGGLVIGAMRQEISGKKSYEPTLEEIQSAQGQPGFADALTYKLMAAAQVTGTLGLYGEILRQSYEAMTGRMPQGFQYPALSVIGDFVTRTSSAATALSQGEAVEKVVPALVTDLLKSHVQAARIIRNQLGRAGIGDAATELRESNQKRDLAVYQRIAGEPLPQSPRLAPGYDRISEREFDRASLPEAAKMVPGLIARSFRQSGNDPEKLQSSLRKLRSADVTGMPSPDEYPQKFVAYYNWVKQTQGEEAARKLMTEYMSKRAEHKLKSQMIPSLR